MPGFHITIRAAVRSELTEVDRNRLTFAIEAFEGHNKIEVATHKGAVIPTAEDVG